jgi:hypothetical protein
MATVIKKGASKNEIHESIRKAVQSNPSKQLAQLAGKLKARVNPVEYQKSIRNEWK